MEIQSLSHQLAYPRPGTETERDGARAGNAVVGAEESSAEDEPRDAVVGQAYTAAGRYTDAAPERVGISVIA